MEESLFQYELRYRWPDSNEQVETKVVGNSCSFWLIDEIAPSETSERRNDV